MNRNRSNAGHKGIYLGVQVYNNTKVGNRMGHT